MLIVLTVLIVLIILILISLLFFLLLQESLSRILDKSQTHYIGGLGNYFDLTLACMLERCSVVSWPNLCHTGRESLDKHLYRVRVAQSAVSH